MKIYAILGIIVALSAIGAGIYNAGKAATRAEYDERVNAAIKAAYEARDKALEGKAAAEAKSVEDMQEFETKARKDSNENKRKVDLAVASAGKLGLRNVAAICTASNRSAAAQAGSAARAAAEAEGAELRRAYAEPFIPLAAETHKTLIQQNECVAIAVKDREQR